MSRTARSWCPRNTLPPLPSLIEVDDSSVQEAHVNTTPKNEAMTWQQEQDFGQSRVGEGAIGPPYRPMTTPERLHIDSNKPPSGRPHWQSLPVGEPPTVQVDTDDSWLAQQAEFSYSSQQPHRNARGKAATQRASAVEPSEPTHLPQSYTDDAIKEQKPHCKQRTRNKKKKVENSDMAGPPNGTARVYVPPHLRNRSSADAGKADSAHSSGVVVHASPAASDQSNAAIITKSDSVPNGAVRQYHFSTSSPKTSQESRQSKECESAAPEPVVYNGWDQPKADLRAANKNSGNPRWPRGSQPYRKTAWPKSKDMKYTPSSSDSNGGVDFKSNSNGDPYYDIKKLTDWNGDWLPAPETWGARKDHADRHFGAHIEQWVSTHPPHWKTGVTPYYPPDTFTEGKELAPRYWLEVKIGGESLREVWKGLINPEKEPKPLDENDVVDYLPWWELYEDVVYTEIIDDDEGQDQRIITHATSYLRALDGPDARVNFDDSECPSASWMLASADEKVQEKNKRAAEKNRKLMAKRSRPVPESRLPIQQMADRRLHPEANIYIRPVKAADVKGISEIYNYYINNTIFAHEFDERTMVQIAQRIQDIVDAGLPYLVAVSKSNQSRANPGCFNEKIAGFINLDDHCDQSSSYRYTFEMQLYVHPGFVSKGIGKCLVDRLLEMADTSYRARGGYEYVNDDQYLKTGPSRVIKTILLNVHHEHGENLEADWRGKFLSTCKFFRVGRIPEMAYKSDKVVDVSIFAHHTKEDINPSARPTVGG
ncbi:hypothetical protein G6011_10278 [Alternaria panax]|uniref:N-acetyltransferase domain-containing protein n=1 Tax=Alternaria panax TaxID=48097 RepID=A0AAD4NQC9_9PLEO|nr:hypothetical protein G6011_10278 [Alternaria panax]